MFLIMKVDSLDNSAKAKTSLMKVKVKGIRIVHYITVYMGSNLLCPCKNCVQWAAHHIQYLCELGLSNCGFPTSWLLYPHNHDFQSYHDYNKTPVLKEICMWTIQSHKYEITNYSKFVRTSTCAPELIAIFTVVHTHISMWLKIATAAITLMMLRDNHD